MLTLSHGDTLPCFSPTCHTHPIFLICCHRHLLCVFFCRRRRLSMSSRVLGSGSTSRPPRSPSRRRTGGGSTSHSPPRTRTVSTRKRSESLTAFFSKKCGQSLSIFFSLIVFISILPMYISQSHSSPLSIYTPSAHTPYVCRPGSVLIRLIHGLTRCAPSSPSIRLSRPMCGSTATRLLTI